MNALFLADMLLLTAGVVVLTIGALTALVSANAVKRLGGLLVAQVGVMVALAALNAPATVFAAGVALGFAQLIVGAALVIRLQEAYGSAETGEFDAADEQSEPPEPSA